MRRHWKQVVVWTGVGLIVLLLALAGGFYLWFRGEVGASNKRIDPDIVQALQEKPSTTLAPETSTTTSSLARASTTTSGVPSGPTVTAAPLPSSTTISETTTTTSPFESPSGMNMVLVGYDKRAEGSSEVTEGRSDTIILVHIDPEKGFLSLLSVPRDLRVVVKGYGHRKINAAYAFGGGALLIRTIQAELGVDLDHYAAVDLEAFKAITNALGGVYVDVDRIYDDGKIELDPGYQLLDGLNALRFVRTRHDQNIDFGRMERQQRFLSAVREQVMNWNLPFKLPGIIKGFVDNADTDLSANELIKLAYWVTKLDSGGIKRAEITGPTGSINGSFYILPSEKAIASAVKDFLTPPVRTSPPAGGSSNPPASEVPTSAAALGAVALSSTSVDVVNATGRVGQAALAAVWLDRRGASVVGAREADQVLAGLGEVRYPSGRTAAAQNVARALGIEKVVRSSSVFRVTAVLGDAYKITGEQVAAASGTPTRLSVWRPLQKKAGFALLAPTYLPSTLSYAFSRSYSIDPSKKGREAVRVGYRYQSEDLYLGISATRWRDAPLAAAGVEVQGDGVVYTVVGASNKADHVWWVKNDILYWVSNTLFAELTREQLLAIALSGVELPAN